MYEWIRDFEKMRTFFCGPDIVPVKIGPVRSSIEHLGEILSRLALGTNSFL